MLSGRIVGGTVSSTDAQPRLNTASGELDGVTIGSNLTVSGGLYVRNSLSLANGTTLSNGGGTWYLNGGVTIDSSSGTATVVNAGSTLYGGWGSAGALTLGSGITLQGYGALSNNNATTLFNNGRILANTAGQTFTVNPSSLINGGRLGSANGGVLALTPGALSVSGGSLEVDGGSRERGPHVRQRVGPRPARSS